MAQIKCDADKPAPIKEPEVSAPPKALLRPVRTTAPYAYYEDDGTLKNWPEDHVITDQEEIALLQKRGAPLVPHEVEA